MDVSTKPPEVYLNLEKTLPFMTVNHIQTTMLTNKARLDISPPHFPLHSFIHTSNLSEKTSLQEGLHF